MHCQNSQRMVRYKCSDLNNADVLVAEFRDSIKPAVPQIVSFLSNDNQNVRIAGADALSKLSEQGNVSKFPTRTLLIYS